MQKEKIWLLLIFKIKLYRKSWLKLNSRQAKSWLYRKAEAKCCVSIELRLREKKLRRGRGIAYGIKHLASKKQRSLLGKIPRLLCFFFLKCRQAISRVLSFGRLSISTKHCCLALATFQGAPDKRIALFSVAPDRVYRLPMLP